LFALNKKKNLEKRTEINRQVEPVPWGPHHDDCDGVEEASPLLK